MAHFCQFRRFDSGVVYSPPVVPSTGIGDRRSEALIRLLAARGIGYDWYFVKMSAQASLGIHGPRIKLLSDLHRPLEEHWAGTNKKGKGKALDAIGSDYLYKHHITQLEEIYKTKNVDPLLGLGVDPLAIDNKNVSPQAQLYGIEGLLSPHLQPGYEAWKSKREGGWDPYLKVELPPVMLEKVSALAEKRVPPPPKVVATAPRSPFPGPPSRVFLTRPPLSPLWPDPAGLPKGAQEGHSGRPAPPLERVPRAGPGLVPPRAEPRTRTPQPSTLRHRPIPRGQRAVRP